LKEFENEVISLCGSPDGVVCRSRAVRSRQSQCGAIGQFLDRLVVQPDVVLGRALDGPPDQPRFDDAGPRHDRDAGFDTLKDASLSSASVYNDSYAGDNYTLTTTIKDVASGQSEVLTISGGFVTNLLGKSFIAHAAPGADGYSGNLNNVYTSVTGAGTTPIGPGAVSFTLGSNVYTFALTGFTSGGAPDANKGSGSVGSFTAFVDSSPAVVPEPSSAVLCGLGGIAILGVLRRRKLSV
jgi:hypothetical protein